MSPPFVHNVKHKLAPCPHPLYNWQECSIIVHLPLLHQHQQFTSIVWHFDFRCNQHEHPLPFSRPFQSSISIMYAIHTGLVPIPVEFSAMTYFFCCQNLQLNFGISGAFIIDSLGWSADLWYSSIFVDQSCLHLTKIYHNSVNLGCVFSDHYL